MVGILSRWLVRGPRLLACVSLVLLATPGAGAVIAAETPDLTGLSLEELMDIDVVYGASRFEQKVTQAPSSVTVISSEEIRRYGYTTLAEIVGSVRGLYTSYDRNYSFIGVRGFQRPGDFNMRTLIMVDGHRLNDSVYGSVLLGTDSLVNVEGDRRHLERGVLGLAGPGQRGVEVRIVPVLLLAGIAVGGLGDQPDGRVVLPLLALVVVLLDAALTGCWLSLGLA